MKKTIIALMALAGVAMADTANEILQRELAALGYTAGDSFAITLTFNGAWSGLTTGTSLNLSTQANQGTQFIAISSSNQKSWPDGSDWTISHGTLMESTTPVISLEMSATEAANGYWITPALGCNASGQYYIDNGQTGTGNTSFTITYNGGEKYAVLSAVRTLTCNAGDYENNPVDYTYTTNVTITDWELDATQFNINNSGISSVSVSVPEPTTATLSLLALAGLAARRRRC